MDCPYAIHVTIVDSCPTATGENVINICLPNLRFSLEQNWLAGSVSRGHAAVRQKLVTKKIVPKAPCILHDACHHHEGGAFITILYVISEKEISEVVACWGGYCKKTGKWGTRICVGVKDGETFERSTLHKRSRGWADNVSVTSLLVSVTLGVSMFFVSLLDPS